VEKARSGPITGEDRTWVESSFVTTTQLTFWAARRLSALAGKIEEGGRIPRFDPEHRSCIVSSILASVAFPEAMINELYQDAYDNHGTTRDGYIASWHSDVRSSMRELWRETDEGSGLRLLSKYQLLLALCGHERLDQGAQPYQDAHLLVRLRNTLAHYQPKDLSADVPPHGCTDWGHQAARSFTDKIVNEIGVQPNYMRLAEKDFYAQS
jgi:hypothetical protein